MDVFAWIESSIGKTPVVTLEKSGSGLVVAKLERANLTGSIKDRLVLEALKEAIDLGHDSVVEATTGNTGISLAAIGSALGLHITIVMPKIMTKERQKLIKHYGAELVLAQDMPHARNLALEISEKTGAYFLDQFNNPANLRAGKKLGMEILDWLRKSGLKPDNLVMSVGTSGSLVGSAIVLKGAFPRMKVYATNPIGQIDGTNDGVETPFLNLVELDGKIEVTRKNAIETARALARTGLGVGISSGANVYAANQLPGTTITVLPDSSERYFSTELFEENLFMPRSDTTIQEV